MTPCNNRSATISVYFALLVLCAHGSAPAIADELVKNGGFEEVEIARGSGTMLPAAWTATAMRRAARFGLDESVVHAGTRSAVVETLPGRRAGRYHFDWFQKLSLEAGATYRLSAFVRCEALPGSAFVVVQFWKNPSDRDGQLLDIAAARPSSGGALCSSEAWEHVETPLTVPEGTTTIFLRVGLNTMSKGGRTDFGGKAWFDAVTLVRVDDARSEIDPYPASPARSPR